MGNYQNWAEEHLLLWRCLNKSIFLARQGLCLWNQSYKKVCIINLSRNIEIKVFNERNLFSVWFRTCPNCLSVLNSDFDSMKTFTIASEFLIGLFETVVQNVWEDCSCCSCFVHKGWMFCSLDLDTEIQSPLHNQWLYNSLLCLSTKYNYFHPTFHPSEPTALQLRPDLASLSCTRERSWTQLMLKIWLTCITNYCNLHTWDLTSCWTKLIMSN